jgi:hypothetical protein
MPHLTGYKAEGKLDGIVSMVDLVSEVISGKMFTVNRSQKYISI